MNSCFWPNQHKHRWKRGNVRGRRPSVRLCSDPWLNFLFNNVSFYITVTPRPIELSLFNRSLFYHCYDLSLDLYTTPPPPPYPHHHHPFHLALKLGPPSAVAMETVRAQCSLTGKRKEIKNTEVLSLSVYFLIDTFSPSFPQAPVLEADYPDI